MNIPWIPIAVVAGIVIVIAGIAYLIIQSGKDDASSNIAARKVECKLDASDECVVPVEDPSPDLPGEWIDLPTAWKDGDTLAHYGASGGDPNTNAHVTRDVDYSAEKSDNSSTGLPPVGGPHWGQGSCGDVPAEAPAYCGPVPWGVYRQAWPAASVVHNMEHGGVVIWYHSADLTVRDNLENWVADLGDDGAFVVLMPYPDIPDNTVAMTSWSRREIVPVGDLTEDGVKTFIRKLNCHFNPEGFSCGNF